jgi:hypothetical protein
MQIIGCDLHARQQTLAMLDTETREIMNRTLTHEGHSVREFYSALPDRLSWQLLPKLTHHPISGRLGTIGFRIKRSRRTLPACRAFRAALRRVGLWVMRYRRCGP